MPNLPRGSIEHRLDGDGPSEGAVSPASSVEATVRASSSPLAERGADETLRVVEERLSVGKRRRSTGTVEVGTATEIVDAIAEVDLDRYRVEVSRVPIGRVVDAAPLARSAGDTTIIPVIEERLVTVKQLFLVEELHVRHVLERETVREPTTLRRQRAVVRRLGPRDGSEDVPMPDDPPRALI